MLSSIKHLFTSDPTRLRSHTLYVSIVTQARKPVFYRDWQVADTLDGRFDMIVLHLSLVICRLEASPHSSLKPTDTATSIPDFIRLLSEAFFADMDRSLREMGSSDTGVGIRVKKMAQAFYGRLKAYAQAIDDSNALAETLRRNVWREQPIGAGAVASLAAYIQRNHEQLKLQSIDALIQGHVVFSD